MLSLDLANCRTIYPRRYFFADGLQLFVDGEQYGTVSPGEGFHTSAREHAVPHAANWLKGSVMAPLDQMVSYILL